MLIRITLTLRAVRVTRTVPMILRCLQSLVVGKIDHAARVQGFTQAVVPLRILRGFFIGCGTTVDLHYP